MRVGVSAKVFFAYALLVVAFATSSVFSLTSLHRARQRIVAHTELLEIKSAMDAAWRNLLELDVQAREPSRPLLLRGPAAIERARGNLTSALDTIDADLRRDEGAWRHQLLTDYRAEILRLDEGTAAVQARLPLLLSGPEEEFAQRFVELKTNLDLLNQRLNTDAFRIADDLATQETRDTGAARITVLAGLLVAIGAALGLYRTLRPLKILRERTRQIAGGDYGQRIGLTSRDEIGQLASEFDAMGAALEERERRLIHSERLATVGKVAAQITHEIRNPLASIGLNAELLTDELPQDNDEGRRLVASIAREVDRLSDITESYLRFVRLPTPKVDNEDPGALVTSVLEFTRAELNAAGVELRLDIQPDLPEVAVDENQIRQALMNLVRNAREAMTGGGVLQVQAGVTNDGRVRIAITDNGPGIPVADLPRIFEPFFSTKQKGTGLGLALVHQIISEHGGRIDVEHPPEGGTRFVIFLPARP